MNMRIVDMLRSPAALRLENWAEALGFDVHFYPPPEQESQIGYECGAIAANVARDMFAACHDYRDVEVSQYRSRESVAATYALAGIDDESIAERSIYDQESWELNSTCFMWESEVEAVLRAKDVPPNVIPVRPFEQTVRIITEFYSLAMDSDRPKVLISNTDIGLDSGTHYFTVAFSIVPK